MLTPEQESELRNLIGEAVYPIMSNGGDESYSVDSQYIVEFINSLLSEKNTEIESLKARRITSELEQMCEDFIGQRDADSYPRRAEANSFARSIGFKLVELVEQRQKEDEVQS